MNGLVVQPVESRRDRKRFLRLPWSLYAEDSAWVPPLLVQLRARLSRSRNPYFSHAEAAFFLATRNGKPVGRISAQVCQLAQQYQEQGLGHYGLFECEDNKETARALFAAAGDWLREKGMHRMMGPFDLSINDEVGMLVEGFERPPCVMMGHHLEYYQNLVRSSGFEKEMDLYAYYQSVDEPYSERIERILRRAVESHDLQIRSLEKSNFDEEMRRVLSLFKDAWSENWGYVPPTQAEVDHLIAQIRVILDRGSVLLTEVEGELAGFMVVLPNVNEFLQDLDGKLFPIAWAKLLWRMKREKFKNVRVPLMGVRKQYQRSRIGAAIALSMIDVCRNRFLPLGVTHCEMSWILETNSPMRGILESAGCQSDKTYRVFVKTL
ncbi:MAG: hypothetical protein ACR2NZ_19070 [Rubripirellula sp.]